MALLDQLSSVVGVAFAESGLDPAYGSVVVSQRPELAQFQCNGALAAAKQAGRRPREIAEEVASALAEDPRFAATGVAGPGFINLTLTDEHLASVVGDTSDNERLGVDRTSDPRTVLVDYAGPNVAKAMHVGHIRATIIGDALARMFSLLGHRVIRDPHFGDWGYQMGLLIALIEERSPGLPYFAVPPPEEFPSDSPVTLDDLQQLYPEAAAQARDDPSFAERARLATVALQQGHRGYRALWRHMKAVSEESQRHDFGDLGVEFDLWYGESDVADRLGPLVDRLRVQGSAVESQGALIVDVSEPGDTRELPPLILETSAGGYLYSTTDLATLDMRVDDLGVDLVLYVVDARQSDHFEQLFRAARTTGLVPDEVALEHIKFGTMNGPDGRPFKTREGGVVRLRDLIDMVTEAAGRRLEEADIAQDYPEEERAAIARAVGIGTLKFADLSNHRTSNYILDLDRFTDFQGKTGPYVQYGTARCTSILRRAEEAGLEMGPVVAPTVEAERELMLELVRLPEAVGRAVELRAPNHVAEFAFDLTRTFSRFYDSCHILSETDPTRQASWLTLVALTRRSLMLLLDLLGIEVPERM